LKRLGKAATSAGIEAAQEAISARDIKAFAPALMKASKRRVRQMVGGKRKRPAKPRKRRRRISHSTTSKKRRRIQGRDIFS